MSSRRLASALCALTLPLAMVACSSSNDTLAEPDLSAAPTSASTEETTESAESSKESSSRPSTTVSTIYETESDEAEDTPAKKDSDKGPCDWKSVEEGEIGDTVQSFCDGKFARVGKYATDDTKYLHWDGKEWVAIEPDGTTLTGFNCYDEAKMDELGIPAELKENMIACD